MEWDRPQRLLDLAELLRPSTAPLEIAAVMHNNIADYIEDGLESWSVLAIQRPITQRVVTTPPKLSSREAAITCLSRKSWGLSISVFNIGLMVEMAAPDGLAPSTFRFKVGCSG